MKNSLLSIIEFSKASLAREKEQMARMISESEETISGIEKDIASLEEFVSRRNKRDPNLSEPPSEDSSSIDGIDLNIE